MKFKGVIFDLDGTLVNSLEDLADSMNIVLEKLGFPTHELKAYKHLTGKGIKNLVRDALPDSNKNEKFINECFDSFIEVYRNNCINKTKPYVGIVELLNEFSSRNIKISVFSNKADELTKKIILNLFPKIKFSEIMGLTEEKYRKPSPRTALLISKKTGIKPEEMIYVGDTDIDMQTANNAEMYAVGVLWGFRTKEELIANGAKHVINNPLDLVDIL
ncbi:MAG: HAD family hydrolase [Bacteroidetes bacterium]|nr:HAD family hydrolase [Bacteroidota bacterium]